MAAKVAAKFATKIPGGLSSLVVFGLILAVPPTQKADPPRGAAAPLQPLVIATAAPLVAAPATSRAPAAPVSPAAQVTIEPLSSPQRLVHVESVNTGDKAVFNIGPRGYVPPDQIASVENFFRCRRTEREHAIAPGVLVLLADIADRWPGHVIEIVSGFRAAPFGAPHSRHFIGHAIDLRVRGVRTTAVRDFVWREHEGIGVGHYAEGNFVHVDSRPEDGDIAWSAPEESSLPEYNPPWAKRARRGQHRRSSPALAELGAADRSPGR
jgi:uncharacterized protein YcbK (DUF882 family)